MKKKNRQEQEGAHQRVCMKTGLYEDKVGELRQGQVHQRVSGYLKGC